MNNRLREKPITDIALLVLRVGASAMMLTHGIPKLMKFFSPEPVSFMNLFGMGMVLSLALAVFAEVVCAVLVMFGLKTRLAAIPVIITMLVAGLYIHAGDPFKNREMSLLYALVFTVILIAGGGKYALDRQFFRKK